MDDRTVVDRHRGRLWAVVGALVSMVCATFFACGCARTMYGIPKSQYLAMDSTHQEKAIREYFSGQTIIVFRFVYADGSPISGEVSVQRRSMQQVQLNYPTKAFESTYDRERAELEKRGIFIWKVPSGNQALWIRPNVGYREGGPWEFDFEAPPDCVLNFGTFTVASKHLRDETQSYPRRSVYAWDIARTDDVTPLLEFKKLHPEIYDALRDRIVAQWPGIPGPAPALAPPIVPRAAFPDPGGEATPSDSLAATRLAVDEPAEGLTGLDIATVNGDVEIRGADVSTVRIETSRPIPTERPRISRSGEWLSIRTQSAQGTKVEDYAVRTSVVSYVITIPRRFAVRAESINGRLVIDGIPAMVELKTVNGAIKLIGASAPERGIHAESVNGNVEIRVDTLPSAASIKTVGGEVGVTVARDIRAGISVETAGGPVTIAIPETTRFSIDARTKSGPSIATDWGAGAGNGKDGSTLRLDVNGGGPTLNVSTTWSLIRIVKIGP